MKKMVLIVFGAVALVFAAPKCNYDKAIQEYEKRMDKVQMMKGATITKKIDESEDGVSRIQKLSNTIKSGQFMGLRHYLVFGFVGCELQAVRTGKLSKDMEIAVEATVYLRKNGSIKAACDGKGRVLEADPLRSTIFQPVIVPNRNCICYDRNSLKMNSFPRDGGCAEAEDYDENKKEINPKFLDFIDPFQKPVDNSKVPVKFEENEFYFAEGSYSTRGPQGVKLNIKKNLKKIAQAISTIEGDDKDGRITLKVTIDVDGTISAAEIVSSTISNNDAKKAIKESILTWKFGATEEGDATVFMHFTVLK